MLEINHATYLIYQVDVGPAKVSICSIYIRFILSLLCLPRSQGGLGFLDPALQINARQWRWLHPLLHPTDPTPATKTSLPYIRVVLNYSLAIPAYRTYHWSLLFSACRPSRPNAITAPLYNFLRAVDAIERKFGCCHVSIGACLRLPFTTLLEPPLPPTHPLFTAFQPPQVVAADYPGVLQLTGNDVLTFHTDTQVFQVRTSVHSLPHRNSSLRAIRYLTTQQMMLTNFVHFNLLHFVPRPTIHHIDIATITNYSDSSSHVSTLLFSLLATSFPFDTHTFLLSQPSNQGYKSLPLVSNIPSSPSPLGAAKWKQFWTLQIPLPARNTWFRILHGEVTTCEHLHRRQPTEHSPYCRPCRSASSGDLLNLETEEHFLFSCPHKLAVWRYTLSLYISTRFARFTYDEYLAILHLRLNFYRSSHELFPALSVFQVFACIQQAIWSAHYRQVFQHSPFLSSNVISFVIRSLTNLDAQLTFEPSLRRAPFISSSLYYYFPVSPLPLLR